MNGKALAILLPAAAVCTLLLLAGSRPALADDLSGEYIEGKQQVTVNIKSWGDDCGPQPKSYSTKGGKKITVSEKGDNLQFSDGNSTKKCWSDNTRLKRISSTKKGQTWITICETAEHESRFERGEYTLKATADGLSFANMSVYNWQLKESICRAVITITKNYKRSGASKPEPGPEPEVEPESLLKKPELKIDADYPEMDSGKCEDPGDSVRLAMAPSSYKLGAGEKICFNVFGLDDKGCRNPVISPSFSMSGAQGQSESRIEGNCFLAGNNAALSEGSFRIHASAEGMHASAKVEVKFKSVEDLIAVNLEPSRLAGSQDSSQPGAGAGSPAGVVEIHGPRDKGRAVWLYIIYAAGILLACCVLIIAVTLVRIRSARRHIKRTVPMEEVVVMKPADDALRPPAAEAPQPAPQAWASRPAPGPEPPPHPLQHQYSPQPPQPRPDNAARAAPKIEPIDGLDREEESDQDRQKWMHCEVCKKEFGPGSTFCPNDGSELKPYKEPDYHSAKAGLICPVCRRGYKSDVKQCIFDKTYLVPYSVFASQQQAKQDQPKGSKVKICPFCQKQYDDSTEFCGEDGSKLEPIQ
ncbi:MAG: hypothetical protein ABIJ56_12355 [Pseudomonadota bacterium]